MNNSPLVQSLFDDISDEYFAKMVATGRLEAMKRDPTCVFHPVVRNLLNSRFESLLARKVCVLGSGDNLAAFAFASLGAEVTSVDVSSRQLENAAVVAEKLGVSVDFVCDDAMVLEKVTDATFDLVFTSNGFMTFVSDLPALFTNIFRILKDGGVYLLFDTHPFMRPFAGYVYKTEVKKPYEATGPFTAAQVFHWRMQDLVNPLLSSGLVLERIEEMHAEPGTFWTDFIHDEQKLKDAYDWHKNGLAALPQWIALIASKDGRQRSAITENER